MSEEIRAAAYCRFSSEMQRDGYSIEAQRLAIFKYCEAKGMVLGQCPLGYRKAPTGATPSTRSARPWPSRSSSGRARARRWSTSPAPSPPAA